MNDRHTRLLALLLIAATIIIALLITANCSYIGSGPLSSSTGRWTSTVTKEAVSHTLSLSIIATLALQVVLLLLMLNALRLWPISLASIILLLFLLAMYWSHMLTAAYSYQDSQQLVTNFVSLMGCNLATLFLCISVRHAGKVLAIACGTTLVITLFHALDLYIASHT